MSTTFSGASRTVRWTVAGILGLSVVAVLVGNAFTPVLLRMSPVLLLAIQSSYAQMALASTYLDPVTFVALAATRRWIGETIAFTAGRVFGPEGLAWYERQGGRPGQQERLQRLVNLRFSVLRDLVVFAVPHPLLSALFGAVRMPPLRFVVLKLAGSVATVTVVWFLADQAAAPLATGAAFVEGNAVVLTVIAVAVVALAVWQRLRQPTAPQETRSDADWQREDD